MKAVLRRLQEFTAAPYSLDQGGAVDTSFRVAPGIVLAVSMVAAAVLAAVAAFALFGSHRPALVSRQHPPPVAALEKTVPQVRPELPMEGPTIPSSEVSATVRGLETALGLMNTGHVHHARKQLLDLASEDAADVAWALARSYDPNFLNTLPVVDASPDIEEATRWYRAWHAAAVKQGLVGESVPIERIIGSMR